MQLVVELPISIPSVIAIDSLIALSMRVSNDIKIIINSRLSIVRVY